MSTTIAADVATSLAGELRGFKGMMEDLHAQIDEGWPHLNSKSGAIQDKIAAIELDRTSLRAALAPFAAMDTADLEHHSDDQPVYGRNDTTLYMRHFRAARTALREAGRGGET